MLVSSFKALGKEIPKTLLDISKAIRAAGGSSYLVGGFVRDAMLGMVSRDYDVEVYGLDEQVLLSILQQFGRPNLVGKAFGVIHLMTRGMDFDFSFPRTENKIGQGHRGFLVETHLHLTFAEAALRRDFTVNAMGLSLPELELSDPYNGKGDLEQKILRHVSSAFAEDSLRVLRGVQFASRFSLTLAPETIALCRSLSLADLSSERIFEEFKKWLLKPGRPSLGLDAFLAMDLSRFFPEIGPLDGSFEKLGKFLDAISLELPTIADLTSEEILSFAVLLSGAANEREVNAFLFRITNEVNILRKTPSLWKFAPRLLENAKDFKQGFSDEFLRRASVELGGLRLALVYLKCNPLLEESLRVDAAQYFKQKSQELGVFDNPPEPLLKGADLLSLGLKPGKQVGKILKEEFEFQLQGKIETPEAALKFAKAKIGTLTSI